MTTTGWACTRPTGQRGAEQAAVRPVGRQQEPVPVAGHGRDGAAQAPQRVVQPVAEGKGLVGTGGGTEPDQQLEYGWVLDVTDPAADEQERALVSDQDAPH